MEELEQAKQLFKKRKKKAVTIIIGNQKVESVKQRIHT